MTTTVTAILKKFRKQILEDHFISINYEHLFIYIHVFICMPQPIKIIKQFFA